MNNLPANITTRKEQPIQMSYPKSIKAAWLSDAGHGWLSVPNKALALIGVKGVSTCSYMTSTRSYLEEDADANVFFDRLHKLGIEPDIKPTQAHWVERSFVRSLGLYNQYWIDHPFGSGSEVFIPSINKSAVVVGKLRSGWTIRCSHMDYRIPVSNPFRYVHPPRQSTDSKSN